MNSVVAPRDSGVDDVDAVDAGLLPRGELLRDLFRRAGDVRNKQNPGGAQEWRRCHLSSDELARLSFDHGDVPYGSQPGLQFLRQVDPQLQGVNSI